MGTGIVNIGSLRLESGILLENVQLAYERIGRPEAQTVLVCHALTGNQETVGTDKNPGWWSGLVGRGKSVDINQFSVISFNVLGGCDGSTGPLSINPSTGESYGSLFPEVTIRDMVHAERKALTVLGIDRLRAVIGASLGGMRVLEWGILYADDMDVLVPIAVTPTLSAYGVGLHAIGSDTGFSNDDYTGGPPTLVKHFDPISYYALLCAMNTHDIGRGRGGIEKAARQITAKVLAFAFTDDFIYPIEEIRAFAHLVDNSNYILVNTAYGHDGFLTEFDKWGLIIKQFLEVAVCRQSKSLYSVSAL
ncbi:alpha/beta fold hydrolase [Sporosarcina sp. YIM B06819]|uniref:homoserine O-acetyltransferase family protein n=1 Tax=Sporosarcina sp. YIM B06819 TaxID=3081769 RepID=UPI00298CF2F6|nr:alpha/beta fold hydrolase [Sporosarcina sp. YIM B06819]